MRINEKEAKKRTEFLYRNVDCTTKQLAQRIDWKISNATLYNYQMGLKTYLKSGRKRRNVAPYIWKYIEEVRDVEQKGPKTTVEKSRAFVKPWNNLKNSQKLEISENTLDTIKTNMDSPICKVKNNTITCCGVKVDDTIKIFEDEKIAKGFILGIQEIQKLIDDDSIKNINLEMVNLNYIVK